MGGTDIDPLRRAGAQSVPTELTQERIRLRTPD